MSQYARSHRARVSEEVVMGWLGYALLRALAATAILAKVGVRGVASNVAVLLRTGVVLILVAGLVYARGEATTIRSVKGTARVAVILSGIATGKSWLAYFKALQLAPASYVAPVDKLSLPITVILATVLLGESLT